jgi:hypothetical protein
MGPTTLRAKRRHHREVKERLNKRRRRNKISKQVENKVVVKKESLSFWGEIISYIRKVLKLNVD